MTNIPQPILEALKNDRLVLWIGAGFSQRRLGLPSWRGLVDELIEACLPAAEAAALKAQLGSGISVVEALEQLKTQRNTCTGMLKKRFEEHFEAYDERLLDFHLLWFISQKIITTNYDMGLDCTKPAQVRKVLPSNKWQLQDLSEQPYFYLKLHGCATDPESCVLFADQYADLYRQTVPDASSEQETHAKFRLKQLMADNVVLFLGFGMEESVSLVLDYLHTLLDGTGQAKFLLTQKGDDRTWPHTEKWLVDDWDDVPQVLNRLSEAKMPYAPVHEPLEDVRQKFQRDYVGRDEAVNKVEAFFNSERRFFFLYGAGGMGKSHLLDAAFKRLEPARRPLYFKITRSTRLSDLARAIGMPFLPPARQDRPHPAFLKAIEQLNRPVVVDDFYECFEEILYHSLLALPDQPKGQYMLISRSLPKEFAEFDSRDFRPLELRELDKKAFRDCLNGLNRQFEYFPDLPDDIAEQCWLLTQGYPLGGHLLLGLFAEPDFDSGQIQRLDLERDPERKKFVERLLAVILKTGRETERDLAHQIAVFDEAVPEIAFIGLPAWHDDREPFHALWKRKGLLARHFEEKTALYGMHALIRSLLLEKFGDPPEARKVAGAYYEDLSQSLQVAEQLPALEKALDHYERSPETDRDGFVERIRPRFVDVNVVQLRDKADREHHIQSLLFRLRIAPEDVSASNELGMAYRAKGNLIKAIEVLQKAADAGHVHSMNELGITLREAGQREKAIEVLQKAVDLQPDNVILLNELGIALRQNGMLEQAVPHFEQAAAAGNFQSSNELVRTLRDLGMIDEALRVLELAMKQRPKDEFFKRNLLQIYLFYQPAPDKARLLLAESGSYLKGVQAQVYLQTAAQLEVLLHYTTSDLAVYRQYIAQLFFHKSWHFAVEYLAGLVQKHQRGEFKAKLGEALCQPVIGRSQEGIPLLREAMEELSKIPALLPYWQHSALVLLKTVSNKGKKEFRRNYERLEPGLRGYPPFEEWKNQMPDLEK